MSIVNALKKSFSINSAFQNDLSNEVHLCFIKTRKAILKELFISKTNGNLVGVYCKALGEGMFLVGINNIETDRQAEIVEFETYDQSGMLLSRTRVSIDEIKMIYPFNKKYVNPILNKLHVI